jgi:hypothetical protein
VSPLKHLHIIINDATASHLRGELRKVIEGEAVI